MKIGLYTIDYRKFAILSLIFLVIMDISIIFNIEYVRKVLSFIFLSIIPGLLLLTIFRLKTRITEKIILSVGLSIAFVLGMGIITNQVSLFLGYNYPLSIKTLLPVYNLLIPILIICSYLRNKTETIQFNLKIKKNQMVYYLIPLFFPILAIMGTTLMNKWDINYITFLMLLLIPLYIIFISIKKSKIPNRIYPYSLFLIGISLLLMYALRSNYIIFGADTDWEYYLFSMTLSHEFWTNFTNVPYDSCISISILPTIYQKFSSIDPEFLFRILYPLLFSISPLIVYSISKKYIGNYYSFLSAFFFISFYQFFTTNNRIDIALIFFGLVIFAMFSGQISNYYKKFLLIIFLFSIVISHYSTAFITLFILILSFIIIFLYNNTKILRFYIANYGIKKSIQIILGLSKEGLKKPKFGLDNDNILTITLIVLFFAFLYLWDAIVTQAPFDNFVYFIDQAFINMNSLFLFQQGNSVIQAATGQSSYYLGFPGKIELILSWIIIFITSIGVLGFILRKIIKIGFLKNPFENINAELVIISFVGVSLLIISFISPFISTGYNILRTFFQMLFFLNIFFVIGAFFVLNFLKTAINRLTKRNYKLSERTRMIFLLIIIIPYFMCTTGTMYQLFHVDKSIALNSEGKEFDDLFIHQQEIVGAEWLKNYGLPNSTINTDDLGRFRVIIGGLIDPHPNSVNNDINNLNSGYIYLRYYNVVNKEILSFNTESSITTVPLSSYNNVFSNKSRIYDNGGTQILI